MNDSAITVLDRGFVALIDHMGSDLTPVNAARVSYGKRKEVFDASDAKLLKYLVDNNHSSPYRHAQLQFHIKAPIFVLRQWMKHRIGSEFNELSGRYTEFGLEEFFVPEIFRKQAVVNKQGSEGVVDEQHAASRLYSDACRSSFTQYKTLLRLGVAKEQARGVLPVSIYSEVYWTASLQAVAHFLTLRLDGHAQQEIVEYAQAVQALVQPLFPVSLPTLLSGGSNIK